MRPPIGSPDTRAVALADADAVARCAALVKSRFAITELNHDLEWLNAGRAPDEELIAIGACAESVRSAFMPVKASDAVIAYTAGRLTILKWNVRQFNVTQGPLTIDPDPRAGCSNALRALARALPVDGAVFISAVPCDGPIAALLEDVSTPLLHDFHILKWGAENWHCKIDWTGKVETYLASLGADSRRNFKRYEKKLFSKSEMRAEVRRFQTASDIDRFLDDGIKVSDKTYQKNLLGLGLARGGPTERRIRFAAERQSFLGHILYLQGEPAAFHLGFLFGESFFAVQMGYDPAYSVHQPGAVLFFHVLQDLERMQLPVRVIDCMAGVTDFKLRTTNRKERIQNYYLLPRTMRGFATCVSLRMVDRAIGLARVLAQRVTR